MCHGVWTVRYFIAFIVLCCFIACLSLSQVSVHVNILLTRNHPSLLVHAIFMKTLAGLFSLLLRFVFTSSVWYLFFLHTVAGLSFVVAMPNSPWTVIPVAYPTALFV
jgi:hypothetical protein